MILSTTTNKRGTGAIFVMHSNLKSMYQKILALVSNVPCRFGNATLLNGLFISKETYE